MNIYFCFCSSFNAVLNLTEIVKFYLDKMSNGTQKFTCMTFIYFEKIAAAAAFGNYRNDVNKSSGRKYGRI